VAVAVSGMLSGIFVVIANAWMNTPAGFTLVNGVPTDIRPFAAMANAHAFPQTLHMTLAAYAATGFAVAGIHALLLRRHPGSGFHRKACGIALAVGAVTAILQPLSGDIMAKAVARNQPVKLAALEGHFETMRGAPLRIGGWPDEAAGVTRWSLDIPYGLSFLAFGDPHAEVRGLDDFPRDQWPPVAIVHLSFQVMVACGTAMALVGLWSAWRWWRRKRHAWDASRRFLLAVGLCAPLGFLAIETGWIVTEVGRQPWIIYGIMRTRDAVTPMPGLIVPFLAFTALYILLGAMTVWLIWRQVIASPSGAGDA
jgi:cytochrome d ubiquinol oxidase subunit I